jgi:hypothetical protein
VLGNALFQDAGNGSVSVTWPDATYNGLALATDNGHIGNLTNATNWPMNAPAQMSPNVATVIVYMPGAVKVYNNGGTIPAWTTYQLLPLVCGVPQTAQLYLANVATMSATEALEGSTPVSIPFDTTPGTSLTKARIKKPGDTAYSWVPIVINNGLFTATNTLTGNEVFLAPQQTINNKKLYYDNYPDVFANQYIELGTSQFAIYGITNKFVLDTLPVNNFENLNNNARPLTRIPYYGQAKTKILINGVEKTPTIVQITSSNYLPEIAAALAQNPSDDVILLLTSDRITSYNSDTGLITWQERSGTVVRNYISDYDANYFSSNQFLLNEYTVKYYNDVKPDTVLYSYIGDNGATNVVAIDRTQGEIHSITSQHIQSQGALDPNEFVYRMFYQNTTGSSLYLLDLSSSLNTSLVIQSSATDLLAISLGQINTLKENTFYVGHVEPTWTSVHVPTSLELTGSFPSAAIVWQDAGTWNTNLASTEVQAGSTGTVTPTVNTLCYNVSGAPLQYAYSPGPTSSATGSSSGTLAADTALYVDAGATVDFTTDGPATGSTTYTVYLLDGTTTPLTVETAPIVGTVVTTGDYSGVYNTISATSSSLSNSMQGDFFMNTSGGPMYLYSNMLVSALITVPDGSLVYVGVDEAITLMVTEYIFSTIPLSAVTTVGPSAPSNVYVWSTGTGSSTSWHSAVSGTTSLVDDLRNVDQSSTSTVGYYSIDASSRPYVAYNSTNASIKYMWPTQGSAEYTLQASRAVYISASTAKFYMATEQMSAPAFIASQLTLAAATPRSGKPVVTLPANAAGAATSSFGSIVKAHIASGDLTAAGIQGAVDSITTGGRMAVKFHMDYTRVLEDAIEKKIVSAATNAFIYSGTVNLSGATGLTAPVGTAPGTPGVVTASFSSEIVKGSYFKTSGGVNNALYNVTINGASSFTGTATGVSNLDALVWNGTSFDNLASFDSAVTIGGDAGTASDAYLSVITDPSSDGYIVRFNSTRLSDEIATCLQDAKDYTDDVIGTLPANMGPSGAVTVQTALETLLADIASETNRARASETLIAQSLESSMATARVRLQLLEAFMYTTEQYMELTDASGAALDFGNQIAPYTTAGALQSDVISSVLPSVASWPVALTGTAGQASALTGPTTYTAIATTNFLSA